MPETSGAANGKFIQSARNATELASLRGSGLSPKAEIRPVNDPYHKGSEKLDVASLYTYYSQESGRHETDVPLALLSLKLGQSVDQLRRALSEADELHRENHVSIAVALFFETAVYVGLSLAFDEAFALLSISIAAHRASPYSLSEVRTLMDTLEKLRQSPSPSDEGLQDIYDCLSSAGFDVNAPFVGVELGEEAEE